MTSEPENPPIRDVLWRLAPMIYGPTILFALGEGAVLPLLPVLAADLGADVATSAGVAGALVIGQLCGNLPAGAAVGRFGERWTMVGAGILAMLATVGAVFVPHIAMLAAAVFIIGFSAAAFGLARHSFMTTRVPYAFRARALALLGGSFRLGMFIGPFVTFALMALFDDPHAALWFFAVCLVAAVCLAGFGTDPETAIPVVTAARTVDPRLVEDSGEVITGSIPTARKDGVFRTMVTHRGVLARLGVAAACLSSLRSARQVAIPLWGVAIGLDAETVALVVGISGAIDFALFYASGQIMDRYGRLWAALPAMLLMAAGFFALALTFTSDDAAMWFAMFAAVLGVGNGLSSGILMTIGADLAPQGDPAAFLGSWRMMNDSGGTLAPVILTTVTAVASLPVAVAIIGGIGLFGAAAFARWLPRILPRRP